MFYHMVQSFPKGANVDPRIAHEAARRLAGYFKGCEVLVCTHVDREHIHSHCIINSVNFETGIRVRISDGELLRKITLLMNRVIANADLMLPHPKVKPRDSAVVLNLQQKISDEMEQERPSEDRIATLLCEIAGQLYKETNAKTQIAAQIARKRTSLMKPQDAFNAAYFSELIDTVSLHVGGGVVLHTKTETDICESEEEPNGSPENSETDSFRN